MHAVALSLTGDVAEASESGFAHGMICLFVEQEWQGGEQICIQESLPVSVIAVAQIANLQRSSNATNAQLVSKRACTVSGCMLK